MRKLSGEFLGELKDGFLKELVTTVQNDRDLDLEIRDNYINIYYKGHSLLKLEYQAPERYSISVASEFKQNLPIRDFLGNATETHLLVEQLALVKENVQRWRGRSIELEYEQLIVRANNYEASTTNSDYLILDRQYARRRYEIDLVGIFADIAIRRGQRPAPLCFIEIKYGLNPDIGKLAKQLNAYYEQMVKEPDAFAREMQGVLEQKAELELVRLNISLDKIRISADPNQYEFIIILIDYHPKSEFLGRALEPLKQLPFARQIKILKTGFGLWRGRFTSLE